MLDIALKEWAIVCDLLLQLNLVRLIGGQCGLKRADLGLQLIDSVLITGSLRRQAVDDILCGIVLVLQSVYLGVELIGMHDRSPADKAESSHHQH